MSDLKMNKMELANHVFDVFEKFQPGEFIKWDEEWTVMSDLHWTRSSLFVFESDGDIPPRDLELHVMFASDETIDEVYSIISNEDEDIINDLPLDLLTA